MGETMTAALAARDGMATGGKAPGRADSPPRPMAEPATARALWPTFMRRTLAEDMVREQAAPRQGA